MPRYEDVVSFDSVIIIESLKLNERHTGRELYDQVLRPYVQTNPQLTVSYNRAATRREFFAYLEAARDQFFKVGRTAVLHLEAHGDKGGIRLADDEVVEWGEFREVLTDMNAACGVNLLLMMAMCKGWYISQLLWPLQRSPVWGLIGPMEDVYNHHLFDAMCTFYTGLLSHGDGPRALKEMNSRVPEERWHYHLQTAELLFCKVMRRYVDEHCTPEQLTQRENELVAEIVRRRDFDIRAAFEARDMARQLLVDHERAYDFYRETFLMFDLFPENRQRMRLSYTDCIAATGASAA